MACRLVGAKPLSEPMMVSLLTHICVTRPQWVKIDLGYLKCIRFYAICNVLWVHMPSGNSSLQWELFFALTVSCTAVMAGKNACHYCCARRLWDSLRHQGNIVYGPPQYKFLHMGRTCIRASIWPHFPEMNKSTIWRRRYVNLDVRHLLSFRFDMTSLCRNAIKIKQEIYWMMIVLCQNRC